MRGATPTKQMSSYKAHNDFAEEFRLHEGSGTGVLLVRSREPHRVMDSLRDLATERAAVYKQWSTLDGWTTVNVRNGGVVGNPEPCGFMEGLFKVNGLGLDPETDQPRAAFPEPSYCVMEGLHPYLTTSASSNPAPDLVALLRKYAMDLSATDRRVIILVPEGFAVPEELQHDLPVLEYGLPDTEELADIIRQVLEDEAAGRESTAQVYTPAEMQLMAQSLAGLTSQEAASSVSQALIKHKDSIGEIEFDDINGHLMKTKTAIVRSSGFLSIMDPIEPEQVGGLDLAKKWICDRAIDFSMEAQDFGCAIPKGCALCGPPGTGKTLIARTFAAVLKCPAVELDFGALFGGIVGQTEANVRRVIKMLTALGKVVVFCDEIDRTGGMNTSGGDGGINKRVIAALLTFMQSNTSGAFMVFAFNDHAGVDPALIRRGRLDEVFSVLPPNDVERMQILQIKLLQRGQRYPVRGLEEVVKNSRGYVGADLESAVKMAVSEAFRDGGKVTGPMLLKHVQSIKPLSVAFKTSFESQRRWAADNATPSSSPSATEAPEPVSDEEEMEVKIETKITASQGKGKGKPKGPARVPQNPHNN